ncbi:MAG: PA14 domain-containing protein [Candidatus Saccharibacteria bacterium]|nr:PA14 domain-containing protein [Candidatus Saccharibacteria bacterium]
MERKLTQSQPGFTIIELLVVISLLAVLLAISSMGVIGPRTTADVQSTTSQLISDIKSQQIKAMNGHTDPSNTTQDQGIIVHNEEYTLFSGGSACDPSETAYYEKYDGINGTALSELYSSPNFPSNPSSTQILSGINLSSPINIDDNFGARVSALLCPPDSGEYIFYVTGDDETELRLSTDTNPANVSVIASVPTWAPANNWTTFPEQTSEPVNLLADTYYYIEVNYKEGSGGDHGQIGWMLPDGTLERPIVSNRYSQPSESDVVTDIGSDSFTIELNNSVTLSTTLPSNRLLFLKGSGEVSGLNDGNATITVNSQLSGETNVISINKFGATTVNKL